MSDHNWWRFKLNTRLAIGNRGILHFEGEGNGIYESVKETAYHVVATVGEDHIPWVRQELAELAWEFDQDSIALTVGQVEFVK